jgi:hypothetical protein
MGRIRTIKPETPQSEDFNRLSRESRLLYILLWTFVDDSGRARANSRMLASQLYPNDDDVPGLIESWLQELEREGKIRRYQVNGSHYLDIPKWLNHQKIDRPTPSRLPGFDEASRELVEPSTTDLGPRTLDLGPKRETPNGVSRERDDEKIEIEAVRAWNDVAKLKGLPQAQRLTEQRKRNLRARLADCGGINGWNVALAKVRDSPHLTGANDRGWRADLDFMLTASKFTRIMEGFYDERKPTQSHRSNGSSANTLANGFAVLDEIVEEAYRRERGEGDQDGQEDAFRLPGIR